MVMRAAVTSLSMTTTAMVMRAAMTHGNGYDSSNDKHINDKHGIALLGIKHISPTTMNVKMGHICLLWV